MLGVEPLRAVGRHEDDLLPAIARACAAAGITARDIGAVAVSIGPGGYTSLRVACAAGKMIAAGVGAACYGVPTPMVVAHAARDRGEAGRLGVLLAGKDQSAFLTLFSAGEWTLGPGESPGRLVQAADFPVHAVDVVVGDRHLPGPIRVLLEQRGIRIAEPAFRGTSVLAAVAHLEAVEPLQLAPLYPREPDAVTLWKQRGGAERK
jgi:tRNA threonylcarbamoyl adenosine modification protein YeaZ